MDKEANEIFKQYTQLNESIGLGPNGASTVTITIGSNTNHTPRNTPGDVNFTPFSDEEDECSHTHDDEDVVYIQAGTSDECCGEPDCDHMHDDGEIDMARAQLLKAAEYATSLFNHLENVDNLEGWTASKITKASDYLSSVYHALQYDEIDCDEC